MSQRIDTGRGPRAGAWSWPRGTSCASRASACSCSPCRTSASCTSSSTRRSRRPSGSRPALERAHLARLDWALLMLVILHSFLGVRTVVRDHIKGGARTARHVGALPPGRCCCSCWAPSWWSRSSAGPGASDERGHPSSARAIAHARVPASSSAPAAPACGPRSSSPAPGVKDRGPDQALPHPLPHRRGPGRHLRRPGQPGGGPLGVAHVRHRQGRRLPGRPGRGRDPGPRGHRRGHRAGAHGPALQPHRRRPHRPAALRRPHPQLRRGAGPPRLLRGRPHRPHDPADALPAVHQARRPLLRRVPRGATCSSTAGRRPGRGRLSHRRRRAARLPVEPRSCSPRAASGACSGSPPTPTR